MSEAIIGAGTTIGYSAIPPTTYTTIAEVFNCAMPEYDQPKVKATHYTSPNRTHEYIEGWKDGSDLEFELNYTSAERAALLGIRGVMKTWKLTYPDGATDIFKGYVSKVGGAIPNEDRVTMKVTLTLTGDTAYTEPV